MQRPPPPTNRSDRPLLFTTQANSSQSSSGNSSVDSTSSSYLSSSYNSTEYSYTNSSRMSAAPTELDYDSMDDWAPIQFNYLFFDSTVPNGPGTFVNLDSIPSPPPSTHSISLSEWISGFSTESRPTTPIQDNDEEPEDTGAGIGM